MIIQPKQMDLQQFKSIFMSKTFWGAVVALAISLAPTEFAKLGITAPELVVKLVAVSAAVFTVYGRLAAKKITTITGNPPKESTNDRLDTMELQLKSITEFIEKK